jgi:hypothetical protein
MQEDNEFDFQQALKATSLCFDVWFAPLSKLVTLIF